MYFSLQGSIFAVMESEDAAKVFVARDDVKQFKGNDLIVLTKYVTEAAVTVSWFRSRIPIIDYESSRTATNANDQLPIRFLSGFRPNLVFGISTLSGLSAECVFVFQLGTSLNLTYMKWCTDMDGTFPQSFFCTESRPRTPWPRDSLRVPATLVCHKWLWKVSERKQVKTWHSMSSEWAWLELIQL